MGRVTLFIVFSVLLAETLLSVRNLCAQTGYAQYLELGSIAPEIDATDIHGKRVVLSDMLKRGNVVVMLFRGVWCPNANMGTCVAIQQEILDNLTEQVIAICPESPEYTKKLVEAKKITIPVIADEIMQYTEAYCAVEHVYEEQMSRGAFKEGLATKRPNTDGTYPMALPAIYVVDTNRRIKLCYNANTNRPSQQAFEFLQRLLNE
ncbi:MAG: redoxin domain-containing protein [Bacteroidia bacterium]|nr:redoxin domain-containing protein [Bacteroidia bacterium]MDW8301461.1 redoxin domain-containing protein [Bacteroidia bacterium]